MKQHQTALRVRTTVSGTAGQHRPSLISSAIYRLAVFAAVTLCLAAAPTKNDLLARELELQAAPALKAGYVPQGRQMERYKAFARQTELPPITATNTLVEIGRAVNTDTTRLAQLSAQEKQALAGQFRIPVAVVDKLVQRLATGSPVTANQFAQEIRLAVIDYRFLHTEWVRYHPSAEGQPTKAAALGALQDGDINTSWKLYDGLRRPQSPSIGAPAAPANLRVVSH
jgi:hypothetical protein